LTVDGATGSDPALDLETPRRASAPLLPGVAGSLVPVLVDSASESVGVIVKRSAPGRVADVRALRSSGHSSPPVRVQLNLDQGGL
jgi:hypothetical protein